MKIIKIITYILLISLFSTVFTSSISNSVHGVSNTLINSSYNAVQGNYNFLKGNANGVFGSNHFVSGNANLIGDPTQNNSNLDPSQISHSDGIIGDKNRVVGSYNALVGDQNNVTGNANGVFGNNNQVKGNGNLVQSNFIPKYQGNNIQPNQSPQQETKSSIHVEKPKPESNNNLNYNIGNNPINMPPAKSQFVTKIPPIQFAPQKTITKNQPYPVKNYEQIDTKNALNMNYNNPFVTKNEQKRQSSRAFENNAQKIMNPNQKQKNVQYKFQVNPINYQKTHGSGVNHAHGRNLFSQKIQNSYKNEIVVVGFKIVENQAMLTDQIKNIFIMDLNEINKLIAQKVLNKLRKFNIIIQDSSNCKSISIFEIRQNSISIICLNQYIEQRKTKPAILLYLFAKVYYQFVLLPTSSANLQKISTAYTNALSLIKYSNVYNIFRNKVTSPALHSQIQYFAIMTQSFFSSNIFKGQTYPFTNLEFKQFDFLGYSVIAFCWDIKNPENLSGMIGQPANYDGLKYRMI